MRLIISPYVAPFYLALTSKHLQGGETLRQLWSCGAGEFQGLHRRDQTVVPVWGAWKQHATYSGFEPSLFSPVARRKTSHQSAHQLATVRSGSLSRGPQLGCFTLFLSCTPSTYQWFLVVCEWSASHRSDTCFIKHSGMLTEKRARWFPTSRSHWEDVEDVDLGRAEWSKWGPGWRTWGGLEWN